MSAFYALAHSDRIELATDGAVYKDDGTLTDIRRKVWVSDRHPIAITGRGSSGVTEALATVFLFRAATSDTVDEALEAMQGVLDRRREKGVPEDVEMVVCAISESRGPRIGYLCTSDIHGVGAPPWTMIDVGRELCGGCKFDVDDVAHLDGSDGLRGVVVPIFEAMRKHEDINPVKPGLPPVRGIGGHIDLTIVRPEGVTVERIHEWPDVIGEKINPFHELAEAA